MDSKIENEIEIIELEGLKLEELQSPEGQKKAESMGVRNVRKLRGLFAQRGPAVRDQPKDLEAKL